MRPPHITLPTQFFYSFPFFPSLYVALLFYWLSIGKFRRRNVCRFSPLTASTCPPIFVLPFPSPKLPFFKNTSQVFAFCTSFPLRPCTLSLFLASQGLFSFFRYIGFLGQAPSFDTKVTLYCLFTLLGTGYATPSVRHSSHFSLLMLPNIPISLLFKFPFPDPQLSWPRFFSF